MSSREQLRDDLAIMNIDEDQELTKQYVTSKYKKLAKQRHPDKDAGTKSAFQELQNAYRRIIKHLEETAKLSSPWIGNCKLFQDIVDEIFTAGLGV